MHLVSIFFQFSIPVLSHWPKIDLYTELKRLIFEFMAISFTEREARAKKAIAVLIPHSSRFLFPVFRSWISALLAKLGKKIQCMIKFPKPDDVNMFTDFC